VLGSGRSAERRKHMANYGDRNYSCEYQWRRMTPFLRYDELQAENMVFTYSILVRSPNLIKLPYEYWDEIRISTL